MNISNVNDDVKFINTTSLHPRERFKSLCKNDLIKNQMDKKNLSLDINTKKANTKKIKNKAKALNILKRLHYILVSI